MSTKKKKRKRNKRKTDISHHHYHRHYHPEMVVRVAIGQATNAAMNDLNIMTQITKSTKLTIISKLIFGFCFVFLKLSCHIYQLL